MGSQPYSLKSNAVVNHLDGMVVPPIFLYILIFKSVDAINQTWVAQQRFGGIMVKLVLWAKSTMGSMSAVPAISSLYYYYGLGESNL